MFVAMVLGSMRSLKGPVQSRHFDDAFTLNMTIFCRPAVTTTTAFSTNATDPFAVIWMLLHGDAPPKRARTNRFPVFSFQFCSGLEGLSTVSPGGGTSLNLLRNSQDVAGGQPGYVAGGQRGCGW